MCIGAERLYLGHLPPFLSPLHSLIFGSTLLEYNVHKLFNASRKDYQGRLKAIHYALAGFGALLCVFALPGLSKQILIAGAVLGLLSFAYSTPLLPFRYKRRLKDFGLIKIHMLVAVWVLVTTMLPAFYWHVSLHNYWLEMLLRYAFIFPLCIAFDIRDVKEDLARGIHTLPNTIGITNAYLACNLTIAAYFLLGILNAFFLYEFSMIAFYFLTALFAFFAIQYSKKHDGAWVYILLIDGGMLCYGLLQWIF